MVAISLSLAVSWALTRRLPVMPVVSGVVVLVFGALTLWLHDELFIKLKPTIVNVLFGSILLGGLAFGKSLLGYVFDSVFHLDDEGWRKLTFRWGVFFFVLAAINEVVWRSFSTDFWVSFKVFGVMPLTVIFTLAQMPLVARHTIETGESRDGGDA
jgi:intracellular septation protein